MPSVPTSSGSVSTTCGSSPSSRIRSRPTRRLKSWSVPAQLHVGLERDGVVALRERVEELVQRDRLTRRPPLLEVVALQDARDRHSRGEADESLRPERREPRAVELDRGLLADPGSGTPGACTSRRSPRSRRARAAAASPSAGGVADHRGEVADDEDDAVPGVLEMPHLPEDDGVPEVDVRRRRVETDLDRQPAALDPPRELVLLDQVDGAAPQELEFRRSGSHGGPE